MTLHPSQFSYDTYTGCILLLGPWEDETARERTCHSPTYAEAKRIKSQTLLSHGCLTSQLKGLSFFIVFFTVSQLRPNEIFDVLSVISTSVANPRKITYWPTQWRGLVLKTIGT